MEKILLSVTQGFAKVPDKVLRFKRTVLLLLVLSTAFLTYGIFTRTSMDMSVDSFLDQRDPAIAALDEFRRQFGSDDSVFLVYRANDGDVFSRQSLQAIQQLTDDFRYWDRLERSAYPEQLDGVPVDWNELSHIRRVQSIANLRVQENVGDSLLSNRLVPVELPASDVELAEIRRRALAEEDYLLAFYSRDGQYGGLLLQTDFGTKPVEGYVSAVDADEVVLDDSFVDFDAFDASDSFELDYDEDVAVQEVDFESVDMMGYTNFATVTRALYSKYDEAFEFYPVGNPPMMEFMMDQMYDMMTLGIVMILIFILLLWILFRSFSAVLWPMLTIAISIAWTWGITVWLGIPISSMISLTVMLIFAVGIADCVHVMSAYFSFRRQGEAHHVALSKSYGKTGLAIFVTTVTTVAGLSALATSDLLPVEVFALMSAFGVGLALFFTVFLLPILLDVWHPGAPGTDASFADKLGQRWQQIASRWKQLIAGVYAVLVLALLGPYVGGYILLITLLTYIVVHWQGPILEKVPAIAARRPYTILFIFGVIFLLCAYGTSQVRIDSNMSELFREGSQLRVTYEIVDENMAGAQSMEIMIDTKVTDGLQNPDILQAVDALQQRIEERYPDEITRTYSLANIVKDTYQIMNNDDPAYYRVPDSRQMISQLLYLFNSANPDDRRSLVSDDYSRSHISINAYNAGSYQYQRFFLELAEDIEDTFGELQDTYPELDVHVTGSMAIMMRMTDEIARSQFNSFAYAIAMISVIMIVTLGSLQGGLMAMVPNLIPALLGFGLMGLLGVPLDTDTLLIAPLIMGIAVDDTVHFMTHYRVELTRTASISEALTSTIRDVGQAVMFTTMILGMGFALLSFSGYLGMAKMGFFGSAAIFVALLCDLFMIPAMVIIFKPTFGVKNADTRIDFQESHA
jgi:predicted RND superfamily exporter protein